MKQLIPYSEEYTISDIEAKMLKMEQVDCPIIHRFMPGLYIREMHLAAGNFVVGHSHKHPHMNVVLKGILLTKGNNGENITIEAPTVFMANPGKKFGFVLEDLIWLNVYPTEERDVETLERMYLDKFENEEFLKAERLWYLEERRGRIEDRNDYDRFLLEYNLTGDEAQEIVENEEDQIPMPYGDYKFLVSISGIQGKGVFASANIYKGETIGVARLGEKRTPLGRFMNHAINPNSEMIYIGDDIYVVATRHINGCVGGFNGEEITTDYRSNFKLIGVNKCQQ